MQLSIPIEEYLGEILAAAEASTPAPTRLSPLESCLDAVLAEDVFAAVPIPTFTNSAMDGYAVRAEDLRGTPVSLNIIGEQPAGVAQDFTVGPKQAVRIMTGAPVPNGADTVVPSELTTEDDTIVFINRAVKTMANVRNQGEDTAEGDRVLSAGTRLAARHLAAAAAVGADKLTTYQPLRVGIISTGDELVPAGKKLAPGQIYDSNSVLLANLVESLGMRALPRHNASDSPETLARLLDELHEDVDVFLLSGGVSVGRYDVVRNLLSATPKARFQRVAMQPGKPQGFADWKDVPVLAFPGNPVSVFVSFHVFGKPFLDAVQRATPVLPTKHWARAGADWKTPADRRQYLPGYLSAGQLGDLPTVFPVSLRGSGSHLVTTLAQASVLAVVNPQDGGVKEGDIVEIQEIE